MNVFITQQGVKTGALSELQQGNRVNVQGLDTEIVERKIDGNY